MDVKMFEVRDRATMMPVMAVRLRNRNPAEFFLLRRAGFSEEVIAGPEESAEPYIILMRLDPVGEAQYDIYSWEGQARTMPVAHRHIINKWDKLLSGDVIDVEFILGETQQPKVSEVQP